MDRGRHVKLDLNGLELECGDYEPIGADANPAPDGGGDEPAKIGCGSCLHWQDGSCKIRGGGN